MIKRIFKKAKNLDYRNYINTFITLGFIAIGIFLFPNSVLRLAESVRDVGTSVGYYFTELFGKTARIYPTVIDLPKWEFAPSRFEKLEVLPLTFDELKSLWSVYWNTFFNTDVFKEYIGLFGKVINGFCHFLLIVLPFILLIKILIDKELSKENNDYDKESFCLKLARRISDRTYAPIKMWICGYVDFCKEHSFWYKLWMFLWALYFNLIAIFIEFIAYYFYLTASFELKTFYSQLQKLSIDLAPMIRFIPGFVWIIAAIVVLEVIARYMGYNRLNRREARNKGFLEERGVMTIVYGPMGAGKTKTVTDMALSQEVKFRDMAFEIIIDCDFKFPCFNWATFEVSLKEAMEKHEIFTVSTAREWIADKYAYFEEIPVKENLWGYDFERYGMEYNDRLKVWSIWEVLEDYACAYLVYTVQSSLLISNYSIRVDNLFEDLGNFPMWNTDFFKRDAKLIDSYSRHAHILDFDMLRLGKRMLEENPKRYAFGFGVYIISEIDKERKNTPELMTIKANADECNQKNDLFNALVKMSRHACVISNKVFVKIFADLQRPESLGADARELGEVVYIEDHTDMQPTLPFFAPFYIFEALFAFLFGRFVDKYYQYRFVRSDKILPMYGLKKLVASLKHLKDRTCNQFGSSKSTLLIESGRMDGEKKEAKYFIQSKKIYSRRYTTDCLSAIFNQYADKNTIGIDDLEEYLTELGTDEENLIQNSFFQNEVHHYN